jgi:hypothetical protein
VGVSVGVVVAVGVGDGVWEGVAVMVDEGEGVAVTSGGRGFAVAWVTRDSGLWVPFWFVGV